MEGNFARFSLNVALGSIVADILGSPEGIICARCYTIRAGHQSSCRQTGAMDDGPA
jgi:hypothetical protein